MAPTLPATMNFRVSSFGLIWIRLTLGAAALLFSADPVADCSDSLEEPAWGSQAALGALQSDYDRCFDIR